MTAEAASTFATATSFGQLNRTDALAYLDRLQLAPTLLESPPSLELLRQLQSSHITNVPFESLSIHCGNWHADNDEPIELRGGHPVALGQDAFRRIVHLKRGGYCFSLNSTFALLLRYFGFRVSEVAARVFAAQGKDPEEAGVGWSWSPTSHQCAVVDWEGSQGRWFVDVGFGSAQSVYPIPFYDGAEQTSVPSTELFRLNLHPTLPITGAPPSADPTPYWILSHLERPSSSSDDMAYWSPVYAFTLSTVSPLDFTVYNHYNSTHPSAVFVGFFVCTRLGMDGRRKTLYWKEVMVDEKTCERQAKFQITGGDGEKEERWVDMRVGAVRGLLEKEFGMLFPEDYAGN